MKRTLSHLNTRNLDLRQAQIFYILGFSSEGSTLVPFLRKLGLNCSEPQRDRLTGTSSTLISFENVDLELLWLDEKSKLEQFSLSNAFNFIARANWSKSGASPFGLGIYYPMNDANSFLPSQESKLEEPICQVIQDYVATEEKSSKILSIVPDNSTLNNHWMVELDKELARREERKNNFFSDWQVIPRSNLTPKIEPQLTQTLGMSKLTRAKLQISSNRPLSTFFLNLIRENILEIKQGEYPLLEMIFDDRQQQKSLDLRPMVPIVLRY